MGAYFFSKRDSHKSPNSSQRENSMSAPSESTSRCSSPEQTVQRTENIKKGGIFPEIQERCQMAIPIYNQPNGDLMDIKDYLKTLPTKVDLDNSVTRLEKAYKEEMTSLKADLTNLGERVSGMEDTYAEVTTWMDNQQKLTEALAQHLRSRTTSGQL